MFDQFSLACNEYLGFKPRFAGVVCRDPRVPDSIRPQTPLPVRHPPSHAYEDMIRHTATEESPWFVIPADNKWFTRAVVSAAVIDALASLDLKYPMVDAAQLKELATARAQLLRKK